MSTEQPSGEHKKPPIPTPAKRVPAFNIDRRGDRLYNVEALHKWFAISSLLLFVFTIAMVLQDYSREWKRYQREFRQMSIDRARQDRQTAASQVDVNQYNQLNADIEAARAEVEANSDTISALEEELAALNSRFIGVDTNYKSTKATYDADRYEYEEALAQYEASAAANASNAAGLKAQADSLRADLDEVEREMDGYFTERENITTDQERVRGELSKYRGRSAELEKQKTAMLGEIDRLGRQIRTLNPPALVTALINAPLMDFMSPSLQIKQILLPNLFYDQPFKQIFRADRCTTCHQGIDQPAWENAEQPYKSHPRMDLFVSAASPHPVERFGCTSCHGGLDRATYFQTAGHTPRSEEQKAEWEDKYGWHVEHYLETPMLSMPNVEAGCYKCHSSSPEVPQAPALNNGRDLVRIYGCFGCHKMPGFEQGIRKVGPDLGTVSGKLTKDWAQKWLINPKDFKSEARMPKFWFNSNNRGMINGIDWDKRNIAEINAIVEYLWSESKPRTLPAGGGGGNIARGKELVETKGCFGCHAVGPIEPLGNRTQTRRMHGFNLANQGSKVSANWLYNWVKNPRAVWAESKMPSLRLTDSEASDVAAYLSSLKNPEFDAKPAAQTEEAALDGVVLEFLRAGSTDAKARQDLTGMNLQQKNLYAGKALISRYGCYACHNIPGFENAQPIGTELTEAGSKLLSQLDFGFLKVEHSRAEWYSQKLHDPRVFDVGRVKRPDELLKMPNFQFSDQEVDGIVMVLTSMVKDRVPLEMKDPAPAAVIAGRQLVAEKNCRGCHIIEGLGGDIRGHLRGIELQGQLPPNLNTQGHKTQPEWLHRFLMDPSRVRLRPWLNAVMPTFYFTEEEANTIGAYFSALDKVPYPYITTQVQSTPELLRAGERLFSRDMLQCGICHPTGSQLPPGRDPADLAPDLNLAQERLRPDWVIRWLEDPQRIFPDTKMPTNWGVDDAGARKSQFPEVLGGDPALQMRAVRDHLFSLGGGRVTISND